MSPMLPSWMYGDPADVAERVELQASAKAARRAAEDVARKRKEEQGLTPGTVRLMRRLRIRELMVKVMKGSR